MKLSNDDNDVNIPQKGSLQLMIDDEISNICINALALEHIEQLKRGDLVMYTLPAKLAALGKGCLIGIIIEKVKPIYSMDGEGWYVDE